MSVRSNKQFDKKNLETGMHVNEICVIGYCGEAKPLCHEEGNCNNVS